MLVWCFTCINRELYFLSIKFSWLCTFVGSHVGLTTSTQRTGRKWGCRDDRGWSFQNHLHSQNVKTGNQEVAMKVRTITVCTLTVYSDLFRSTKDFLTPEVHLPSLEWNFFKVHYRKWLNCTVTCLILPPLHLKNIIDMSPYCCVIYIKYSLLTILYSF